MDDATILDLYRNELGEPRARHYVHFTPGSRRAFSTGEFFERTVALAGAFEELGVEVCIRSEELGDVWLVPRYTGRDRKEITPEHAATIHHLLAAFPGARVVSFDRAAGDDKETSA